MYADGTWHIDPLRTLVHLRASVLGIHADCKVDVRSATVNVVDGGRAGTLTADIDLTTFRSGIDRRDQHVKSADFLDVAHHPLATFSASWRDGPPTTLAGELTVRDVAAPVSVHLDLTPEGAGAVAFRASTEVSRRALGITRARFLLADHIGVVIEGAAHLDGRAPRPDEVYGDSTRPERGRATSGDAQGSTP